MINIINNINNKLINIIRDWMVAVLPDSKLTHALTWQATQGIEAEASILYNDWSA